MTLFRKTIKDLGADQEWKRGNAALRVRVCNVFALRTLPGPEYVMNILLTVFIGLNGKCQPG